MSKVNTEPTPKIASITRREALVVGGATLSVVSAATPVAMTADDDPD